MLNRFNTLIPTSNQSYARRPASAIIAGCLAFFCAQPSIEAADETQFDGPQAYLFATESVVLNENARTGTVVLRELNQTGEYADYRIESGNEHVAFCIDPHTGRLLVADQNVLNFEQIVEHRLVVSARVLASNAVAYEDDFEASLLDAGLEPEQLERLRNRREEFHVTILLRDVNEPPVVEDVTFEVAESVTDGHVVGRVWAVDHDRDEVLRYSLKNDSLTEPALAIDETTGQLVIADATQFDFEQIQRHLLTVQVSDSQGHFVKATVDVVINDINEPPTLGPIELRGTVTSDTDSDVGTIIVHDEEGLDTLAFDLTDDPTNGGFSIDSTTGVVSIANRELLGAFDGTPCSLTVDVWDDACNCLTVSFAVDIDLPTPIALPIKLADTDDTLSVSADENQTAAVQTDMLATAKDVLYSLSIVSGLVWVFALLVVRGQRGQPRSIRGGKSTTVTATATTESATRAEITDVVSESTTEFGSFEVSAPAEVDVPAADVVTDDTTGGETSDDGSDDYFDIESAAIEALNTSGPSGNATQVNSSPLPTSQPKEHESIGATTFAPTRGSDWLATTQLADAGEFQSATSLTVASEPQAASVEDGAEELNDSTLLDLLEASRVYADNEPAVESATTSVEDLFAAASDETAVVRDCETIDGGTPDAAAAMPESHVGENDRAAVTESSKDSGFPYSELSDTLKELVRPETPDSESREFTDSDSVGQPACESTVEPTAAFEATKVEPPSYEAPAYATPAYETPDAEPPASEEDSLEDCDRAVREHLAALFRRANGEDESASVDVRSGADNSADSGSKAPSNPSGDGSPAETSHAASVNQRAPLIDGSNDESRRVPRELLRSNAALFRELSKRSADAAISTATHRRSQLATKPRLVFIGLLVLGSVGWIAASVLGLAQFGNIGKLLVLSAMASMAEFSYCVYRLSPNSDVPAEAEADETVVVAE